MADFDHKPETPYSQGCETGTFPESRWGYEALYDLAEWLDTYIEKTGSELAELFQAEIKDRADRALKDMIL